MTEKELIFQLKQLRTIKPRKDWVVLTRSRILGLEKDRFFLGGLRIFPLFRFFRYKLTLAPIISVLIIIGLFGFAQQTVPGQLFFSLKKITETAQISLSSPIEKPKLHLKLANKRLEDLNKIAQANEVENLLPAIEEFQMNVSRAAEKLARMDLNVTSSDPLVLKEIVQESQKLEENKEKVEASLGIIVGDTEELESALREIEKQTAAYLIKDLENRTLKEEDKNLLAEAKEDFEKENYSRVLEKIWRLVNYQ